MWQIGLGCVLAAIATGDLVRRWRRQPADARRGLGWLAVASGLMAAAFVPLALPASWTESLPVWLTPVLHLTSQMFFPAALLVAVLGQRIAGLEFVVGRATLWALLSGSLLAIYVAVLALGADILPTDDGVVIAVATAVVAVSFTPLRGVRNDASTHSSVVTAAGSTEALTGVGRRLGTATDDTELLTVIAESVRTRYVSADSRSRSTGPVALAAWPRSASSARLHLERELVVQRESVGRVLVSGRQGELLDRTTLDALDDLTPVVAAVVQLVARTRELTESRARIAEARDEERRALRRELHDGFGPSLAGVALGLRAAGNLLRRRPRTAAPLVASMADELDDRVEEVRTLARGLLPPILDELGLVPAINELADRHRITGGLHLVVTAEEIVTDAAVRQAVYGIVAEAVRNVVRHADATTCTITVTSTDERLVVTVDDDGAGLPSSPAAGVDCRRCVNGPSASEDVSSSPGSIRAPGSKCGCRSVARAEPSRDRSSGARRARRRRPPGVPHGDVGAALVDPRDRGGGGVGDVDERGRARVESASRRGGHGPPSRRRLGHRRDTPHPGGSTPTSGCSR